MKISVFLVGLALSSAQNPEGGSTQNYEILVINQPTRPNEDQPQKIYKYNDSNENINHELNASSLFETSGQKNVNSKDMIKTDSYKESKYNLSSKKKTIQPFSNYRQENFSEIIGLPQIKELSRRPKNNQFNPYFDKQVPRNISVQFQRGTHRKNLDSYYINYQNSGQYYDDYGQINKDNQKVPGYTRDRYNNYEQNFGMNNAGQNFQNDNFGESNQNRQGIPGLPSVPGLGGLPGGVPGLEGGLPGGVPGLEGGLPGGVPGLEGGLPGGVPVLERGLPRGDMARSVPGVPDMPDLGRGNPVKPDLKAGQLPEIGGGVGQPGGDDNPGGGGGEPGDGGDNPGGGGPDGGGGGGKPGDNEGKPGGGDGPGGGGGGGNPGDIEDKPGGGDGPGGSDGPGGGGGGVPGGGDGPVGGDSTGGGERPGGGDRPGNDGGGGPGGEGGVDKPGGTDNESSSENDVTTLVPETTTLRTTPPPESDYVADNAEWWYIDFRDRHNLLEPFQLAGNVKGVVDLENMPLCRCPRVYWPACGQNNITYLNVCILNCIGAKFKRYGTCINYRRLDEDVVDVDDVNH